MIIINKTARVIGTRIAGSLTNFKPGTNDVPADRWAVLEKHFAVLIKAGDIVVHGKSAGVEATLEDSVENLKALKVPQAIELIKETLDTKLLEKWMGDEDRKSVLDAIEKQLDVASLKADEDAGDDDA